MIDQLDVSESFKYQIECMENGISNLNEDIDQTKEELSSVRRDIARDLNRLNDQMRAKMELPYITLTPDESMPWDCDLV